MRMILVTCLLISAHLVLGQRWAHFDTLASLSVSHGDILMDVSSPFSPKQRGEFYVNRNWQYCLALTSKGEVVPFECRFNLMRMHIEASVNRQIRKLRTSAIDALLVAGREYLHRPASSMEDQSGEAFFEVLSRGNATLLKRYEIGIERANDFGIDPGINAHEEMTLEWSLYYTTDGQTVKPLGRTKKNVLEAFAPFEEQMEGFMKDNNLKWRDPSHLSQAFDHFNRTSSKWQPAVGG